MTAEPRRPRQVIELLAGRWTLDVLVQLGDGGRRYQDIHDGLDGIAHQVLTSTLRRAERDGLIVRRVDPGRVETATLYQLTELGRSLDDLLSAVDGWAERNWPQVEAARRRWDRRRG
ncbi:MAG: helix-turn-helix domain-containing protein [Actinomycetota bacterium]|nr:helix-turn-helix domain-containing protein [Actinomycetota bacterium]